MAQRFGLPVRGLGDDITDDVYPGASVYFQSNYSSWLQPSLSLFTRYLEEAGYINVRGNWFGATTTTVTATAVVPRKMTLRKIKQDFADAAIKARFILTSPNVAVTSQPVGTPGNANPVLPDAGAGKGDDDGDGGFLDEINKFFKKMSWPTTLALFFFVYVATRRD